MTTPDPRADLTAERTAVIEAIMASDYADLVPLEYRFFVAALVVAAVEPLVACRVRAQVAEEIRDHADRHAPADSDRQTLRRHLLIAARLAAGPPTAELAIQALARSTPTPTEESHG